MVRNDSEKTRLQVMGEKKESQARTSRERERALTSIYLARRIARNKKPPLIAVSFDVLLSNIYPVQAAFIMHAVLEVCRDSGRNLLCAATWVVRDALTGHVQ
jgi:hypothetical protein